MSIRPAILVMVSLGAVAQPGHAQSRVNPTPVVPPGAPAIEWVPANWKEQVLRFTQVCDKAWSYLDQWGICKFDQDITLLSDPLSGTRGNLTACRKKDTGEEFWCVWRKVQVGTTPEKVSTPTGMKKMPIYANQWLTSLLPDRRLVMHGSANYLYVTKIIGSLADSVVRATREAPTSTYSASREGNLTTRSPAPTFTSEERGTFDLASALYPQRQTGRFEGMATIEGARLDLVGRRFLIVEGGMLRLKQGTTVLESWPVYPKTYIVRYPDRSIEIQTRWAKFGYGY